MQNTKYGTSEATPSRPTYEINQPELSLPVSTEPKITSLLAGEYDMIEIEVHKTLLLKVIEF